ncbi:MAG: FkbM family methyltransferase [Flavobacteriaceae bacterium]
MWLYLKKKYFKGIFLFHKYFTRTARPLKGFYGVFLNPVYTDKTFEYCFKGTYGTILSQWLANEVEDMIFLDIGANQGLYAVLAGKNPAFKKVFAFEPNKKLIPYLSKNLKMNGVVSYQVIQAAISNQSGERTLHISEGHSGKSTLRSTKSSIQETVRIVTMDHAELNRMIPSDLINGIKIDVEGHEEIVIGELVKCAFFQHTKWIYCEIDEKWIRPENIFELLRKEGFRSFNKIGNHPTHYDVLMQR